MNRENMPSHFKFKEYCPLVFRNLRERFGIDDQDFLVRKMLLADWTSRVFTCMLVLCLLLFPVFPLYPCRLSWQCSEVTVSQFSAAVLLTYLHYSPAGCIDWAVGGVNRLAGWKKCHIIPKPKPSFTHKSSVIPNWLVWIRLSSKGLIKVSIKV